jgi:pyridoxine 5-phosphate synthase
VVLGEALVVAGRWVIGMTVRMARLSVNLNKIALLRNSRRTGVPDVLRFATLAHSAGADGITLHPRPDERHVRLDDVFALAELIGPWRPSFELNLEGYPDERFLSLCSRVRPEQCTIVPDAPTAFTSEEGWKLDENDSRIVRNAVSTLKAMGSRVIVFVDPDTGAVERVPRTGADGIEIYTGGYAAAARKGPPDGQLRACAAAAQSAADRGLVVNIGHDLNLENLPALVGVIPGLAEASIGHELTADALEMGFEGAVIAYKAALRGERS